MSSVCCCPWIPTGQSLFPHSTVFALAPSQLFPPVSAFEVLSFMMHQKPSVSEHWPQRLSPNITERLCYKCCFWLFQHTGSNARYNEKLLYSRYLKVRAGDVVSAHRPVNGAELRALPACPTLLLYLSLSVLQGFFMLSRWRRNEWWHTDLASLALPLLPLFVRTSGRTEGSQAAHQSFHRQRVRKRERWRSEEVKV